MNKCIVTKGTKQRINLTKEKKRNRKKRRERQLKRKTWSLDQKLSLWNYLHFGRSLQIRHHVYPATQLNTNPKTPTSVHGWNAASRVVVAVHPILCSFVWIVEKHSIPFVSMLQYIVWILHPLLPGDVQIAKYARFPEMLLKTKRKCSFVKCAIAGLLSIY